LVAGHWLNPAFAKGLDCGAKCFGVRDFGFNYEERRITINLNEGPSLLEIILRGGG